jgi:hypothetical protein
MAVARGTSVPFFVMYGAAMFARFIAKQVLARSPLSIVMDKVPFLQTFTWVINDDD